MYEGFFGLTTRPFSAVPATNSFVALEPMQEVMDDLLICIVQSRGIGVITSSPGLGKTLLCKQVAETAATQFQTIYLSTSAFSTRRALLQAILYEFGIHYEGLTEQEARLKILEAARAIDKEDRRLLIIVDEAHLLNARLFEELRTLTDYAPHGAALISLVLSGQFELEEKLADPAMSAIHQRIGCQVTLQSLSLEDSATLVRERLRLAGAKDISELLTEDSLEAICRASDGNPRCLCQLADHSFLLAFAEEQKPVTRKIVLAALDDLKELPLHWNELSLEPALTEAPELEPEPVVEHSKEIAEEVITENLDTETLSEEYEEKPVVFRIGDDEITDFHQPDEECETQTEETIEYSVIEVGADLPDVEQVSVETERDESQTINESIPHNQSAHTSLSNTPDGEPVYDKYAALDRKKELPSLPSENATDDSSNDRTAINETGSEPPGACETDSAEEEAEVLDAIQSLREEISAAVDQSRLNLVEKHLDEPDSGHHRLDVVEPELIHNEEADSNRVDEPIYDDRNLASDKNQDEPHERFAQLFTRLSQRRNRLKHERR